MHAKHAQPDPCLVKSYVHLIKKFDRSCPDFLMDVPMGCTVCIKKLNSLNFTLSASCCINLTALIALN